MINDEGEVRAAGGVACRTGDDGTIEVLLVHRSQYDDWTLPKGKLEAGETDEECAVREVEEETGLRCRLGAELPSTRWRDRFDRAKVCRYWRMTATDPTTARAQNEIDAVEWLTVEAAIDRLSYQRDTEVLVALAPAHQTRD